VALRFAIRVDASATIGFGHVKRCLALAYALRQHGAAVSFVARSHGIDVAALIRMEGFACTVLPRAAEEFPTDEASHASSHAHWAGVPWNIDASQTATVLRETGVEWVIVDHYALDACWHRAVRSTLDCKVVGIDDLADRAMAVDVLIDHNLADDHRRKYAGHLTGDTILLGGPRFALLGPSYATAAGYVFNDKVRSIGIFMGGAADAHDFTVMALRACRIAGFDGPIEIVTMRTNPLLPALRAIAENDGSTMVSVDLPELSVFFARHDIQIGAGGGATWERCRIGVPTLAVVTANNQRMVVPALAACGAVAALPDDKDDDAPTAQKLSGAIRELLLDPALRSRLSATARALVDGLGARRVSLRLLSGALQVRAATSEDLELTYLWRNDATTRAVSRCSEPINFSDHRCWLEAVLRDPRRRLMVGQIGGTAVGVIRMDLHDNGDVEVSLYLDPGLHGLGLGRALLRAGETHVAPVPMSHGQFVANVLDRNPASRRLFESAGYAFVDGRWTKPLRHEGRIEGSA
jgi:UDP-2,4-diacetamido-2,4,6-trideoxy-beta-L-altropyranose hydrolase